MMACGLLSLGCANRERSRNLADPDVAATTLARQVCSNCHGVTGNAVSPNFPESRRTGRALHRLAIERLQEPGRRDPAGFEYMWGLSRSLTEAQIKGLAAYYAAQSPERQPVEGDSASAQAGQVVFESGIRRARCRPARTATGRSQGGRQLSRASPASTPITSSSSCIVFQRTDERPEGSVMKVVAHALTPQNIGDVAAYVQSLGNRAAMKRVERLPPAPRSAGIRCGRRLLGAPRARRSAPRRPRRAGSIRAGRACRRRVRRASAHRARPRRCRARPAR